MTTDSVSALASYQGYEFQIDVTAWLAVFLLLRQEGWTHLVVEPASEEDIQVDLRPGNGAESSLGEAQAALGTTSLEIQIKLNRSKPWTAAKFESLLKHGKRRTPPLQALASSDRTRFLLVTTLTVPSELRAYEVGSPLDVPTSASPDDELGKRLGADAARLVSRISILSLSTIPEQNIRDVFIQLHIPPTCWEACIGALKTAVRDRLLGKLDRRWARQAVLDLVKAHHGFVQLPNLYEPFVEPDGFQVIRERLRTHNMLVLLGPAGAGKTLAADALAREHRLLKPAYEIRRDPVDFGEIDNLRERTGPYLFLIQDPWGKEQRDARGHRWIDELRLLAPLAKRHFRIIVTSPLGVLADAPGVDDRIERHAVTLDQSNYGIWKRIEILEHYANCRLQGDHRDWTLAHCREIAAGLELPLSIACFIGQVSRLPAGAQPDLQVLLSDSLSEAEAARFFDELRGNPTISDATVYVIWGVLATGLSVTDELLERIEDAWLEDNSEPIHLPRAFKWLRESGWWKPADSSLSVRVERLGRLRDWVEQSWSEAKRVLARFEVAVLNSGDLDSMLRLRRKLGPLGVVPRPPVQRALERHVHEIVNELVAPANSQGFRSAIERVNANIPGEEPVIAIVQALKSMSDQRRDASWFGWYTWVTPEWPVSRYAQIARSTEALAVAKRWVIDCLPHSRLDHTDGAMFEFLSRLGWDLSDQFWEALRSRGGALNDITLIDGSLHTTQPDFLGVMNILIADWYAESKLFDELRASDDVRKASNKQLDRGYEEHLLENLWEDVAAVEHCLEHWVRRWRAAKAAPWPSAPSKESVVLTAWAEVLSQPNAQPEVAEFSVLLGCDDASVRERALKALGSSGLRVSPVLALVDTSIAGGTIDEASAGVVALLKLGGVQLATSRVTQLSLTRQVEVNHQCRTLSRSASVRREILDSVFVPTAINVVKRLHSTETILLTVTNELTILEALAVRAGPLRRLAIETLARHGAASRDLAMTLVDSDDVEDRVAGVKLVGDLAPAKACNLLRAALADENWTCREAAVRQAAGSPACDEWAAILPLARDPSWPVAKAVAEVLAEHPHRATLSTTLELIRNDNDQSDDGGFSHGPIHEVARAGARLLADRSDIPDDIIEMLLDTIRDRTTTAQDSKVRGLIARSIMDERPAEMLSMLVDDPDLVHLTIELLDGHHELRDQVDPARALKLAKEEDPWSGAGWALILGLLGDRVRSEVEHSISARLYTPLRTTIIALSFLCLSRPLSTTVLDGRLLPWPKMVEFLFPPRQDARGSRASGWIVHALRSYYDPSFEARSDN